MPSKIAKPPSKAACHSLDPLKCVKRTPSKTTPTHQLLMMSIVDQLLCKQHGDGSVCFSFCHHSKFEDLGSLCQVPSGQISPTMRPESKEMVATLCCHGHPYCGAGSGHESSCPVAGFEGRSIKCLKETRRKSWEWMDREGACRHSDA